MVFAGVPCQPGPDDIQQVDNADYSDWYPFENQVQFEVADFLYHRAQLSAGNIDSLMAIWKASLAARTDTQAPFLDSNHMYRCISAIPYSRIEWQSFTLTYSQDVELRQPWMDDSQIIWYRDPLEVLRSIIGNPAFDGEFDYVPYQEYIDGIHHFQNFMSGDWAWTQAVSILANGSSVIVSDTQS